jgi:hypothetical protein
MEKAKLVPEFEEAMVEIYRRALSEAKYKASRFLSMVQDDGGLATVRYLIHAPQVSDGNTALWERQRLDLTVEAMVLGSTKWHPLFTTESLRNARKGVTFTEVSVAARMRDENPIALDPPGENSTSSSQLMCTHMR